MGEAVFLDVCSYVLLLVLVFGVSLAFCLIFSKDSCRFCCRSFEIILQVYLIYWLHIWCSQFGSYVRPIKRNYWVWSLGRELCLLPSLKC